MSLRHWPRRSLALNHERATFAAFVGSGSRHYRYSFVIDPRVTRQSDGAFQRPDEQGRRFNDLFRRAGRSSFLRANSPGEEVIKVVAAVDAQTCLLESLDRFFQ